MQMFFVWFKFAVTRAVYLFSTPFAADLVIKDFEKIISIKKFFTCMKIDFQKNDTNKSGSLVHHLKEDWNKTQNILKFEERKYK